MQKRRCAAAICPQSERKFFRMAIIQAEFGWLCGPNQRGQPGPRRCRRADSPPCVRPHGRHLAWPWDLPCRAMRQAEAKRTPCCSDVQLDEARVSAECALPSGAAWENAAGLWDSGRPLDRIAAELTRIQFLEGPCHATFRNPGSHCCAFHRHKRHRPMCHAPRKKERWRLT